MYITNARHLLDANGAIAAKRGPALVMATFIGSVIVYQSMATQDKMENPKCFKCKTGSITSHYATDGKIIWSCVDCGEQGVISNWQNTFWDLSMGVPSKSHPDRTRQPV